MNKTLILLPVLISMFLLNSLNSLAAFPPAAVHEQMQVKPVAPVPPKANELADVKTGGPGFGIASLACGILSFPVFIMALLAAYNGSGMVGVFILEALLVGGGIVFGSIGLNKKLKGLAIAGIVLSSAMLTGFLILLLFLLIFGA